MPPKAISKAREARIAKAKVPVKRPSFEFIAGQVVNLYIGGGTKLHAFHKDLLVNTSPYFRKAFTGRFKEKDGEIVLDDITERAFGILKEWLYAQKLERPNTLRDKYKVRVRFFRDVDDHGVPIYGHVPLEEFDEKTMGLYAPDEERNVYLRGRFEAFDHQTQKFWHWDDLVDVYIMADKYDFPHLRDDIVKQWQYQAANFRSHCTIETVARAFESLPEKSHLLSLIVDHWAFLWKPQPRDIKAMQTKVPNTFSARLSLVQAAHKGLKFTEMQPEFRKSPCSQHEHLGEDNACVGFEKYSYHKTVQDSKVWRNTIVPEEHSEDEDDEDEDEEVDEDEDEAMAIE